MINWTDSSSYYLALYLFRMARLHSCNYVCLLRSLLRLICCFKTIRTKNASFLRSFSITKYGILFTGLAGQG